MAEQSFEDHYETLEISPNANPETIHRVYRMLASRFHPDNKDSGDEREFRRVMEAYRVLSDPEKRAGYDVQHRGRQERNWKIFDQPNSATGVQSEKKKREGVLSLLYRKRVVEPESPYLTIQDLERLLGVAREHLQFTLWYLKTAELLRRSDNGRYEITLQGVDVAEESIDRREARLALMAKKAS